jgi:hypothetical protein
VDDSAGAATDRTEAAAASAMVSEQLPQPPHPLQEHRHSRNTPDLNDTRFIRLPTGHYRLAAFRNEKVSIRSSTIPGAGLGAFADASELGDPNASRHSTRLLPTTRPLPPSTHIVFEDGDFIMHYKGSRHPRSATSTDRLAGNNYLLENACTNTIIDGQDPYSSHGRYVNDGFHRNNAMLVFSRHGPGLVATTNIYHNQEILAGYSWPWWQDHQDLTLRAQARAYYATAKPNIPNTKRKHKQPAKTPTKTLTAHRKANKTSPPLRAFRAQGQRQEPTPPPPSTPTPRPPAPAPTPTARTRGDTHRYGKHDIRSFFSQSSSRSIEYAKTFSTPPRPYSSIVARSHRVVPPHQEGNSTSHTHPRKGEG